MYKSVITSGRFTGRLTGPISFSPLAALFSGCEDFQSRRVDFGLDPSLSVTVCWIDGLVSGERVTEDILRPLTQSTRSGEAAADITMIEQILRGSVYRFAVKVRTELGEAVDDLTHGCCLLLFDRAHSALSFEVRSEAVRAIAQPTLEKIGRAHV